MKKDLAVAIVGIAILIGVVWYANPFDQIFSTSNDAAATDSVRQHESEDNARSGFAMVASNAIYVSEQRPGTEVIVNLVALDSPGYVVIHESVNGEQGVIIGHSALLDSGNGQNIPIMLTRATRDGDLLVATIRKEEGAVGFDPVVDPPARDALGNSMFMVFRVSAIASDPRASQIMF